MTFTYWLPDEHGSAQNHETNSNSVIIIGANGSGKSKLGAWIEQQNFEKVHRIGGQRNLNFSENIPLLRYTQAEDLVFYGNDDSNGGDYKAHKGRRWGWGYERRFTTQLLDDFDNVLAALFALRNNENELFVKQCKEAENNGGTKPHTPITVIDKLKEIWTAVLSERQIIDEDSKFFALVETEGGLNRYSATQMSDGERALLDTNIVIHRESRQATNYSIGNLFYWLDKLRYEKLIHPYTVNELRKANNEAQQEIYTARLTAYTQMRSVAPMSAEFQSKISNLPKSANDEIDYQLLCEVFCGRADILITEDRKMRERASLIGIGDKVFSIDGFITKCTNENPALVEYKSLSVKKELFGAIDINDSFFDSFRTAYSGFNNWFAWKCDEEAYVCRSDANIILGFLYLKTEGQSENYSDIIPPFAPAKRLKVGTFKVESTGFRLGERFIKIIFDNAIARQVDEIYVTLFLDRPELQALDNLLLRWGFYHHGVKRSNGKEEHVLVKKLGRYDDSKSVIANFPNLKSNSTKMILPIRSQYHTPLFPDSILNNEVEYVGNVSHRYALEKVYITWGNVSNVKPGDLLLFYRMGATDPKKYSSVITTVGVVHKIISSFNDEIDYLNHCQNRTVFPLEELKKFWREHYYNLSLVKFVYVKSLSKRLTLGYLWDHGVVNAPNGPRPFTVLSDEQFDMILRDSNTTLYR